MAITVPRGRFILKRPRQEFRRGVCAHPFTVSLYSTSIDLQFAKMQEMGMTDYRFYLPIGLDGLMTAPNITKLSEIRTKASAAGIDLYPILTNSVDYTISAELNYSRGRTMGEGFSGTYGSLFPRKAFELGNETANDIYLTGDGSSITHFDSVKYAKLSSYLKGYADGIKYPNTSYRTCIDAGWKNWGFMDAIIADGVKVDIVAWHWYSDNESSYPHQIAQQLITKYVNTGKEVWLNEVNSKSTNGDTQAVFMKDFYEYMIPYFPMINKFFVYELFDEPAHADTTKRNFGLLTYVNDTQANYKPTGVYFGGEITGDIKLYPPARTGFSTTVPIVRAQPAVLVPTILTEFADTPAGFYRIMTRIPSRHHYAKTNPFNCDNSRLLTNKGELLDANGRSSAGKVYFKLSDLTSIGTNYEWHPTDKDLFYTITNNKLYLINSTDNSRVIVHDFADIAVNSWGKFTSVSKGGGEGNMDENGRYCPIIGKKYISGITGTQEEVIGYLDIVTKIVHYQTFAYFGAQAGERRMGVTMFQGGDGVLVNNAGDNSMLGTNHQFTSYTMDFTKIQPLGTGSHGDVGYDTSNNPSLFTQIPISMRNMLTAVQVNQNPSSYNQPFNGGPNGMAGHTCRANGRKGYYYNSNSGSTGSYRLLYSIKANGAVSGAMTIEEFGHAIIANPDTYPGSDYDFEPSAAVSRDGTKMVAKTNWPGSITVDSYVWELVTVEEYERRMTSLGL